MKMKKFEQFINYTYTCGLPYQERKLLYLSVVDILEHYGWEEADIYIGHDPAFDEAVEEKFPELVMRMRILLDRS